MNEVGSGAKWGQSWRDPEISVSRSTNHQLVGAKKLDGTISERNTYPRVRDKNPPKGCALTCGCTLLLCDEILWAVAPCLLDFDDYPCPRCGMHGVFIARGRGI